MPTLPCESFSSCRLDPDTLALIGASCGSPNAGPQAQLWRRRGLRPRLRPGLRGTSGLPPAARRLHCRTLRPGAAGAGCRMLRLCAELPVSALALLLRSVAVLLTGLLAAVLPQLPAWPARRRATRDLGTARISDRQQPAPGSTRWPAASHQGCNDRHAGPGADAAAAGIVVAGAGVPVSGPGSVGQRVGIIQARKPLGQDIRCPLLDSPRRLRPHSAPDPAAPSAACDPKPR